jgi:hypothetical protein
MIFFNKLPINYIKNIFYGFLFLFSLVVFSTSSLFGFIFTCGQNFCYYKNCYSHSFDIKIKCFYNNIDGFIDWIILDLISGVIIFVTLMTLLLGKKIFDKINKCFFDYKNKYHFLNSPNIYNNHNNGKSKKLFLNSLEIKEDVFEKESLEIEEHNPLFMV